MKEIIKLNESQQKKSCEEIDITYDKKSVGSSLSLSKGQSWLGPNGISSQQCLCLPQSYFGCLWATQLKQIRSQSQFLHYDTYQIRSYLVKSGDDFRQQYLTMQIISFMKQIFEKQNLKLWLKPYEVIPYNQDSGLIQFITDTRSVSQLKETSQISDLQIIYKHLFGHCWDKAIMNFVMSLAGYSLVQYILRIKDRHNNNILIDSNGHLIHIDYAFMLSLSPGNIKVQRAPFKLTTDYINLMQGKDSDLYLYFKQLFYLGLKFIRKYSKEFKQIIEAVKDSNMRCFDKFQIQNFMRRFHLNKTDQQLQQIVDNILFRAAASYTTVGYDHFQKISNNICT